MTSSWDKRWKPIIRPIKMFFLIVFMCCCFLYCSCFSLLLGNCILPFLFPILVIITQVLPPWMGCQSKADWCSPVFLQSFFDHSLVSIYTPGWRDVPLYFFSLFLTIHWYPFILPGGESMGTVKCFAQEPNTLTRPNLTVRLLQSDLNVIFFSLFFVKFNFLPFHFLFRGCTL